MRLLNLKHKLVKLFLSLVALIFISTGFISITGCNGNVQIPDIPENKWVVIGFEYEKKYITNYEQCIYQYSESSGWPLSPKCFKINLLNILNENVECRVESYLTSDMGFSGYSYKISGDVLYIHLRADKYPFFYDGEVSVKITDKKINNINKIILWDLEEEERLIIWERDT